MNILTILQIVVSIALVVLILLQERSFGGFGGIFGGTGGEGYYQARRGFEKVIFYGTIACTVIFIALAIVNLVG